MRDYKEQYIKKGWFVLDLPNPSPVFEVRNELQKELRAFTKKELTLEDYHEKIGTDEDHTQVQIHMTEFFRTKKFGKRIMEKQLSFFHGFMGNDLFVQSSPYLRIARPSKKQDNIGYHRDTFYGGSPYELSVLVPYVDLEKESSLSVMSGSHILSEEFFPTVKHEIPDPSITKGSAKHQLGFVYSPKVMDPSVENHMEPIPLKLGQVLVFCLSTVHGSVENTGAVSRWSSDVRVLNSFAPVDLSARPDYYELLSTSPVTACSKRYFEACNREGDYARI